MSGQPSQSNGFNFDLAKRICEVPGTPGFEDRVRELVIAEMRPLVDELRVDALGNVITTKKGTGGPRVMLAAHMDEIGFMVRYIDDNGFVRLQPLGGFDGRNLAAQRVLVHTRDGQTLRGAMMPSSKPIHTLQAGEAKPYTVSDMFVDLGLSVDEVREAVEIGDMVTMDRTCEQVGHTIVSKSLDDRISVFIMIEALRALGQSQHAAEVVAVATVQEEVGLRGAQTSAFGVDPDVGIALDVTLAGDIPGLDPAERVSKLGDGVAIKVFDSSHIPNHKLVRHLRDIADKHGIKYQLEVLARGGTDAGAMQRTHAGVPAITISTPTRYVHSVNEMAHVDDIQAAIQLVARYLEEAQSGDYQLG